MDAKELNRRLDQLLAQAGAGWIDSDPPSPQYLEIERLAEKLRRPVRWERRRMPLYGDKPVGVR